MIMILMLLMIMMIHIDIQEEELVQQPGHLASAEREIERFERKFLLPLQSSLVIISTIISRQVPRLTSCGSGLGNLTT